MQKFIVLAALMLAGTVRADANRDAERAFFELLRREASGEASALNEFEALGATSPPTIWSDDAYIQAARLAEQRGELARARNNYEKAIAVSTDARLASRARSELARLTANTGSGQWDRAAATHDRLVSEVYGGNQPQRALGALETLVAANPGYPRRAAAVLVIAEGWEREGQADRAIEWLSSTRVADRQQQLQLDVALIHALIRHRDIERAQRLLAAYRAATTADPSVVRELDKALGAAQHRRWFRRLALVLVGIAAAVACIDLWRLAGSWRRMLRALWRPPTEVLFLAPVAAVLAVAASTGNVLVGPAVWQILGGGLAIAWISGATLQVVRDTKGTIGLHRVAAHAVTVVVAATAIVYVALDHAALLDLLGETFAHGPSLR